MKTLAELLTDFWIWTSLPEEKWRSVDFVKYGIEAVNYPKLGEIFQSAIELVNAPLSSNQIDDFLTAMAIDAEDEDILNACKKDADECFIITIVSRGIAHPQSDARWQMAELLRREMPQRDTFLQLLMADPDEYVRKRTRHVIQDLCQSER